MGRGVSAALGKESDGRTLVERLQNPSGQKTGDPDIEEWNLVSGTTRELFVQ
jgi:hypothetical protein